MDDRARDRELFRRVREGDVFALERVLESTWARLLAYARRFLGDSDDAEDVVQDVIVRFWEQRERWAKDTVPIVLLYRLTRNAALNESKRRRVRERWARVKAREAKAIQRIPRDPGEAGELRARIEEAIAGLPERRREAFVLARLHALTYQEVADIMGISRHTVANQIVSALVELRQRLAPWRDES